MSGAIWDDAVRWASLVDGTQCPICLRGRPHAWLTSGERVPVYGYVCVVARRHATEPYDLPAAERHGFWDDVCFAAERVARLRDPVKINYELHGHSVPHLHVHLFPRFRGDRFVGGPIDPRVEPVVQAADDLERLASALAA